jgi:hypothetical protein
MEYYKKTNGLIRKAVTQASTRKGKILLEQALPGVVHDAGHRDHKANN